jgi:hypothetical protein
VQRFPAQLTSFVGRAAQIDESRRILADNRLVTLTGAYAAVSVYCPQFEDLTPIR